MYYTVIKLDGHLRTRRKRRKQSCRPSNECSQISGVFYYVLIDWVGGPQVKIFGPTSFGAMTACQIFSRPVRPSSVNKHFNIWPPRLSFFSLFRVIKFAIGMFTYVAHFDRKVGIYIATKLYAILARLDGFFRSLSRHRVRPSYGDFLNSFAMKTRAGPYGVIWYHSVIHGLGFFSIWMLIQPRLESKALKLKLKLSLLWKRKKNWCLNLNFYACAPLKIASAQIVKLSLVNKSSSSFLRTLPKVNMPTSSLSSTLPLFYLCAFL